MVIPLKPTHNMARFNPPKPTGPQRVNDAGGKAYSQSPELELVSLVLTSFASDGFYQKASDQLTRLQHLLTVVDPMFAAKALVFAREEFGMRSITHAGGASLGKRASGQPWAADFYRALVVRPDDMTETISFALANGMPVTNAMKKGFAAAFADLSPYQMAKYRGEGKGVKLVDVANLVHPKQSEKNAGALTALMTSGLRSDDTWESMLSAAGSDATKKADVWGQLLIQHKLGYFALLRNLRNIAQQAPNYLDIALAQLKDPNKVGKARVLPFRYQTAYSELMGTGLPRERDILWAIDEAAEQALANVPKLDGATLVALDTSWSMRGASASARGTGPQCVQLGALFGAMLAQRNQADMLTFNTGFAWHPVERMGVLPFARQFRAEEKNTDFDQIFVGLTKKYDRIIILSDMQAWIGNHVPKVAMSNYCKRTGAAPQIWTFDLAHAGTMQFPESNVRAIAGFSEKVFSIMGLLEQDKNALVNKVKAYEFAPTEAAEAE